jgi:hypothetical protein
MTSDKIIIIAHNHTMKGDVWVAPIDATQPNIILSPYVRYIKNQLELGLIPNK